MREIIIVYRYTNANNVNGIGRKKFVINKREKLNFEKIVELENEIKQMFGFVEVLTLNIIKMEK